MPSMTPTNSPMISGFFRIAEIHVVGERQGRRTDSGQVAPAFGDRLSAAADRIGAGNSAALGMVASAKRPRPLADAG